MGSTLSGIGSTIGSIGKIAAPLIGMLPGGSLVNAGISAIDSLSGGQKAALGGGAALAGMGAMGGFSPQVGSTSNGATQTGNDFSNYLGGFMQNGNNNQQMMNQALTSMLSGRPGDPTSLSHYFNAGMGTNGQPSTGMANGVQPINVGFTPPQFQAPQLPNVMQGMGSQAGLGSVVNPAANVSALQDLMNHQQQMDVANLRERFGNQALGTGAQGAEAAYRAQALPTQALAVDQLTRQNNDQALTQRGQDLQSFLGSRGLDVSQLGLGSQNSLSLGSMLNNFNQNNSQFGAQFGQQNQSLNNQFSLQNQGLGNNFNLGMQGIGAQLQGMQSGAQQNALAQIMAALGHTQGLGTPQAETTVAPSWGSQVINGAGAIGNIMGAVNQAQNAAPNMAAPTLPPMIDMSQFKIPNFGTMPSFNPSVFGGSMPSFAM